MNHMSILDLFLDKFATLEGPQAYGALFGVLLACGLGVPIPEDITLITAGYLAYLGNIDVYLAMVVCFFGVIAGDFTIFMMGRTFGKKVFQLPLLRYVFTPERVAIAQVRVKKNAKRLVFFARYLAALRAPVYLS